MNLEQIFESIVIMISDFIVLFVFSIIIIAVTIAFYPTDILLNLSIAILLLLTYSYIDSLFNNRIKSISQKEE